MGQMRCMQGKPVTLLRVRNNDFDEENLAKALPMPIRLAKVLCGGEHSSTQRQIKTFIEDYAPVIEMKPDALIMSDAGMIMMVREAFPNQVIHLSVQANAVNWATVKFWQQMGISRVILSRELSLKEIEQIIKEVPDMEVEVLCMGRCAWHTLGGACSLAISTNETPTKALAPMPVAGITTLIKRWRMKQAISSLPTQKCSSPVKARLAMSTQMAMSSWTMIM